MLRILFGSLSVLTMVAAGSALAADSGSSTTKSKQEAERKNTRFAAIVDKVDSKNEKVTVLITGRDGKKSDKTLTLEKDAAVRDIHGKPAKLSDLKAGEVVRVTEDNGKVSEIEKENAAVISNVDAKNGTVTVRIPENGQEVTRVFHLTANADYIDSDGNVAVLDVFRAGDQVLFVQEEGKITSLSKSADKKNETPNVTRRPGSDSTDRK